MVQIKAEVNTTSRESDSALAGQLRSRLGTAREQNSNNNNNNSKVTSSSEKLDWRRDCLQSPTLSKSLIALFSCATVTCFPTQT
ncbi:hypothetical protein E2C01_020127 [Portunus trituberculatus]|uniref:Uncharacterized protein n=1 Tax=Portunus trituberculatus TaxID=210409 RepID=A0A5B7E1A3_PORTR|nr:hypothetical protein [Portunus trituberculatus]